MERRHLAMLFVGAALLVGCGEAESTPLPPISGAGGAGGSAPDCPTGHIVGPTGACMPVGIQGCAEMFIEDDGLCHPSLDSCPPGTIPKFDEGFVPVGIQGCAEIFMEEDGLCHPSMDKCPEGTFAAPLEGCISVDGPDGCATGTWGNIADGPDTIWVDPSSTGGDGVGSKDKPVLTIAEALDLVVSGGRIALAAGDYDEPVNITKPMELVRRCPSMVNIGGTQVTPYSALPVIVLLDFAQEARLRGVKVSGPGIGVLAAGGAVELERVPSLSNRRRWSETAK